MIPTILHSKLKNKGQTQSMIPTILHSKLKIERQRQSMIPTILHSKLKNKGQRQSMIPTILHSKPLELLTSLKTADDLRCSGRENNSWSIISTHGVALYLLIYAPPLFVYLTIPGCLFLSGNGNTIQWWINVRENWRDNQERKIHRNWQHCVLDTGRRQQNKTYTTERLKDEQYVTHQNPGWTQVLAKGSFIL
jgi:hypothetical protein